MDIYTDKEIESIYEWAHEYKTDELDFYTDDDMYDIMEAHIEKNFYRLAQEYEEWYEANQPDTYQ